MASLLALRFLPLSLGLSPFHVTPFLEFVVLTFRVAWSITLAAAHPYIPASQLFSMFGIFGVGAVVMRGAGCTINDLWDRNLDKRVPSLLPLSPFFPLSPFSLEIFEMWANMWLG